MRLTQHSATILAGWFDWTRPDVFKDIEMNRQTYLDQASRAHFGAQWLQLAQAVITADDVKEAITRLEADIRSHSKVARWATFVLHGMFYLILGPLWLCGWVNELLGEPLHPAVAVFGAFVPILALAYSLGSRVDAQETRISMLQDLQPIAVSEICEEALRLVETGHPEVLAWRDLAIAERGQLHRFDVGVMRCLEHQINEAQKAAIAEDTRKARDEQQKRRLEEACRIVHGV